VWVFFLHERKLLLKLFIFCATVLAVVDFAMAGGTNDTNPTGMVGPTICKAAGVMRLEVGFTVRSRKRSRIVAAFTYALCSLEHIGSDTRAPFDVTLPFISERTFACLPAIFVTTDRANNGKKQRAGQYFAGCDAGEGILN